MKLTEIKVKLCVSAKEINSFKTLFQISNSFKSKTLCITRVKIYCDYCALHVHNAVVNLNFHLSPTVKMNDLDTAGGTKYASLFLINPTQERYILHLINIFHRR